MADRCDNVLAGIARRSLYLHERLAIFAASPPPTRSVVGDAEIEERLERWKLVVAKGDAENFAQRLRWNELTLEQVVPLLGPLPPAQDPAPPPWLETLKRVEASARGVQPGQEAHGRLPFEALLSPMVRAAWEALFESLDPHKDAAIAFVFELLEEPACIDLERGLLSRLHQVCAPTFELELHEAPSEEGAADPASGEEAGHQAQRYAAFVRQQLSSGFLPLFSTYPVLARLVSTQIDDWVSATSEFLARLRDDREAMRQQFGPQGADPGAADGPPTVGKVVAIRPDLSDPHHHGRRVMTLEFASGLKLVYKPRSLALADAYYQLLAWCNRSGSLLPLRTLEVLDRVDYGWMEFVEHRGCDDEEAARRFYERAGMVLCLLYVLGTSDCHQENLIASGEQLLLVDAETVMHAEGVRRVDGGEPEEALAAADAPALNSVLRVGLLPRWEYSSDQRTVYDVSGLGSGQPPPRGQEHGHGEGADAALPRHGNVPRIGDVPLSPNDYVAELVRGFENMYRFVLDQRSAFAAADGPLSRLRGRWVRFVHRHTRVYGTVQRHSLKPRFLRDGVSRSIELEVLGRAYLAAARKGLALKLFEGEVRALERLDVPYFWTDPAGTLLIDSVPALRDSFQPPYQRVLKRVRELDEADLKVQVGMIRGSLFARLAPVQAVEPGTSLQSVPDHGPEEPGPLSSQRAVAAAARIAAELRAHAIGLAGGATWVGLTVEPQSSRIRFELVGNDLYNGRSGIALFLAGLRKVSGDEEAAELALSALEPTRRILSRANLAALATFARTLASGAVVGIGSLLYSFVKVSELLDEPELLVDAGRICDLIDADLLGRDDHLDVAHGAAGALLACLAFHATGKGGAALSKALLCGEQLLRAAEPGPGSSVSWRTMANRPALTGFAHGAAGICYALLRLHAVTQQERFLRAAEAGVAFERRHFVKELGNWEDLRSEDSFGTMVAWCTGAAGVGFGRLGGLGTSGAELGAEDLEVALRTTQRQFWGTRDDLCCGNLGRVELLFEAGRRLHRPELLRMAATQAAAVVTRADRLGHYSLFDDLPEGVYNPGFFRGTAGIGYQLLRVAFPEELPSVLMFD